MSKPKYDWWPFAINMARRYPNNDTEEAFVAVNAALEKVKNLVDGEDRMRLINYIYFSGGRANKRDLKKWAAIHIPCSYGTAKRWHGEFIRDVARNYRCDPLLKD